MSNIKDKINKRKLEIDKWIDYYLPQENDFPKVIHKAMRYSTIGNGKRLRPFLVLETNSLFNNEEREAYAVSAAIEMLHTYSLIHDDLPAMDNDDLRRGKPTAHKVFTEDIAILAGDSLCTYSWQVIADNLNSKRAIEVIKVIGRAVGTYGMIGGQVADMHWHEWDISKPLILRYIHKNKTSALIEASIVCGAIVGQANISEIELLKKAGLYLGMEFQIIDDILDEIGEEEKMGKKLRKDKKAKKITYPSLYGIEKSRFIASKYAEKANKIFSIFGDKSKNLVDLCNYILEREN